MKNKSTSPTVALKQRTKARILAKKGKSGGPSIPLPASSDASDPDVPPVLVKRYFIPVVDDEPTLQERRDMLREILTEDPPALTFQQSCEQVQANLADNLRKASEALPEHDREWLETVADATAELPPQALPSGHWIPVLGAIEHHGKTNDLARQTILSRVKRPEQADLSKPQFKSTKKGNS